MSEKLELSAQVDVAISHQRLDQIVAQLFPQFSRAKLQGWIKSGELLVDGKKSKNRQKMQGGELITISATLQIENLSNPEDIDFDVIYEDEDIIVVNKRAGLVVHPGAGAPSGTLMNGLLFRYPELDQVPRAGIVHRLDKDTTGLMVVARTLQAHAHLIEQLQSREMGREYEAIVTGGLTGGGMVDEPIGRHSTMRTKMAVQPLGKEAVTHYRLLQRFDHHSHIRLKLETGRTHQIRVHMAYLHHPLVGDSTYMGRQRLPKGISEELQMTLKQFPRQALHAQYLELIHPATEELVAFEAPLPEDFAQLLEALTQQWKISKLNEDNY